MDFRGPPLWLTNTFTRIKKKLWGKFLCPCWIHVHSHLLTNSSLTYICTQIIFVAYCDADTKTTYFYVCTLWMLRKEDSWWIILSWCSCEEICGDHFCFITYMSKILAFASIITTGALIKFNDFIFHNLHNGIWILAWHGK